MITGVMLKTVIEVMGEEFGCDRCRCGGRRTRRRLVRSRIPKSFSYLERFLFFGAGLSVEDAVCICKRGDGIHGKSYDASCCTEMDNELRRSGRP